VRVLEPANTRSDLGTGVALRIARPMAISLPFIALLVWISISVSLAPLKSLSNLIRARDINTLDPIDMGRAPLEVHPLAEAINQLLSRLRQSIMRERAFVADAAHELKTPLAAIKVQAQVALGAHDLLLLARLDENGATPTTRVDLAAIAQAAMVAREELARERGMRLDLTGGACSEVSADPTLLSIVLDNLIDNAIKYGHEGGHIEIAVCQDAHTVTLTVSDDGPGVTAEDRLRLTNRFFRVIGNRASGSGLGLSIVARIVEYFGGRLGFSTGIGGRGLSVAVAFPRRQAPS
jgi:two-component system sensor histidine kinase QseC